MQVRGEQMRTTVRRSASQPLTGVLAYHRGARQNVVRCRPRRSPLRTGAPADLGTRVPAPTLECDFDKYDITSILLPLFRILPLFRRSRVARPNNRVRPAGARTGRATGPVATAAGACAHSLTVRNACAITCWTHLPTLCHRYGRRPSRFACLSIARFWLPHTVVATSGR